MSEHKLKEQRLTALEERIARLEQVSDQNAAVFSDSLQFAELCIQALQRAADDLVGGEVKTVDVEPAKQVITEGIDERGLRVVETLTIPPRRAVDFKAYLRDALEAKQAAEKEAPSATTVQVERQLAFEFGG